MVPKVNSGANVYGVLQYNRIKVEAGEGSGDRVAAGQHRRVVEMRAALEAEGSSQSKGYTRSLEELRRVLERRNVRFALDITPDGATLAVQVSEDEGVA